MATLAEKWIKDGVEQGLQQGAIATAQEFLLELLETRFGQPSPELRERVRRIEDLAALRAFHKAAVTAPSAEELYEALTAG